MKPLSPGAAQRARACVRLAEAQAGICPICNQPLPEDLVLTEVDHIIPKIRGGPNAPWNKRLVHFLCNRRKKDKLTDEAIALAAEYAVILVEPQSAPRAPDDDSEIPWWSWRNHLDCGRYDPETGTTFPSDKACDFCAGRVSAEDLDAGIATLGSA